MSVETEKLAAEMAGFVKQVSEGLSAVDQQLQKDAALQAQLAPFAKQAAAKLASLRMISVAEQPEWESQLAKNPLQALHTLSNVCDSYENLAKQATAARKDQAAQRAINPGAPVLAKQAGAESTNGSAMDLPRSAQVLLNGSSTL